MKRLSMALILSFALLIVGFGCSAQKKPSQTTPAPKLRSTQKAPTPKTTQVSGASIYGTNCASCHGTKGEGIAKKGPRLNTAEWSNPQKVAPIVKTGKGKMPAFRSVLSSTQITAVSNYVATFSKK